jgi:hypothetical protein
MPPILLHSAALVCRSVWLSVCPDRRGTGSMALGKTVAPLAEAPLHLCGSAALVCLTVCPFVLPMPLYTSVAAHSASSSPFCQWSCQRFVRMCGCVLPPPTCVFTLLMFFWCLFLKNVTNLVSICRQRQGARWPGPDEAAGGRRREGGRQRGSAGAAAAAHRRGAALARAGRLGRHRRRGRLAQQWQL